MREPSDMSSTCKLPVRRSYSDVVPAIQDAPDVRARRNRVLTALRACATPVAVDELAATLPRSITVENVLHDLRALATVRLAQRLATSGKWEAR